MGASIERERLHVGELAFDVLLAGPPSGPVVVLLHGFPQTAQAWGRQLLALADAGFRVLAADMRGTSPGARPAGVDAYALPHLVGDVVGLADAVGAERFRLVGHDWGALVGWSLAARHPQRVQRLVAISAPHPAALRRALTGADQRRRSSYVALFRSPLAVPLLAGAGGLGLRLTLAASGLPPRQAAPYVRRLRDREALRAALSLYRANSLVRLGEVPSVAVPTLLIWGDRDPAIGPEAVRLTGEHVTAPHRLEVLPGMGHWIPEQAADRLDALLLEYLA